MNELENPADAAARAEHVYAETGLEEASVLTLRPGADDDLPFARALVLANMRYYYGRYDIVWQPEVFDAEWQIRENYLIEQAGGVLGFLSVTVERHYLYVRDIQLIENCRGRGIGTSVMVRVSQMAAARQCASVRLKVFKGNPAIGLYRRLGYANVGEESALLWMERHLPS